MGRPFFMPPAESAEPMEGTGEDTGARGMGRRVVVVLEGVYVMLGRLFRVVIQAVCVSAFCVVLAAPVSGAEGDAPSRLIAETKARELLKAGKPQEALAVLRFLADRHPAERNVRFLLGLAAIQSALRPDIQEAERLAFLDEAITALRGILVNSPGLVRVRLELARAFFLKEEDTLAREHFERVLAGRPPLPVVVNVQRFLSTIRKRRRWDVHVGFALAPDTNIGGTSDERVIYIFGLPFVRDAESLTTSGVGLNVWGGGEYQHPLGERLRLRMGLNGRRKEYSGSRFDQTFVSGHVGPRVLATGNTEFSILGSWRHQWIANEPSYFDLGGRVAVRHRLGRRLTVNGNGDWHNRRYRSRKTLDGPNASISLGGAWVLTPTIRLDVTAGYGRQRPDALKYRSRNTWVQGGVSVALPLGFNVGGSGAYRWTAYEGNWYPNTPRGVSRDDKTLSLRASLHNRAFTMFGFSPRVSIVREVRTTNAQLHGYRRTGGELSFVREF